MSLFTIDQSKCKRDGLCVQDCPAMVIAAEDKDAFPSPTEDAEKLCVKCGHCAAICPYGALTLPTLSFEACPPKDSLPGPEAMRHLLRSRRSVRQYKKVPVPHDLLTELIDTARYAPTGSNRQQVYWNVFADKAEMKRFASMTIEFTRQSMSIPGIADEMSVKRMNRLVAAWDKGEDRILLNAPSLVLVHAPESLLFAEADCAIALTYLELYAYTRGLGTCWMGYFTAAAKLYPPLTEALQLPAGHQCYGAIVLGYPQCGYKLVPQRNTPFVTRR